VPKVKKTNTVLDIENRRFGILPFRDITGETEIADWPELIQMLLVNELIGMENLGIIDPSSFNNFLQTQFGSKTPQLNKAGFATLLSADIPYVIDGTILKSGDCFELQSRIVDLQNSEVKHIAEVQLDSGQELAEAVASIASQTLDYLYVSDAPEMTDKDLRPWLNNRSHNMPALKEFMQASEYIFRQVPGAERHLRKAIELDPNFITARIWLIAILGFYQEYEEANHHYEYLLELESQANPFEVAMISWARSFIDGDKSGQAQSLELALKYCPANNVLLVNLADLKFQWEDYLGAIEAITPAVRMNWNYPSMYPMYGRCFIRIGDEVEAKKVLEESLWITNIRPETYSLLMALYISEGDSVKASYYEDLYIRRMKELGADWGRIHEGLGYDFAELELFSRSIPQFRQAITANPREPYYHEQLGHSLLNDNQIELARQEFEEVVRLDSEYAMAFFMLAKVNEVLGDTSGVIVNYQRFLTLDSLSSKALLAKQGLHKFSKSKQVE